MPTNGIYRVLVAMAGVTAGVAAAAVAPQSAHAAPVHPAAAPVPAAELKAAIVAATRSGDVVPAALPTCHGHRDVPFNGGVFHVPTVSDTGTINFDCQLQNGDFNLPSSVKVVQDALNRCEGENLTLDGDYGSLTTAAVKRAQQRWGQPITGGYTNDFFINTPWPLYSGNIFLGCV